MVVPARITIKKNSTVLRRRAQLASAIDYCPTVCDYAGVATPDDAAGLSLRPAVESAGAETRDAIFMEYNGDQGRNLWPMRGIVADIQGSSWKYIWTRGDVDEHYNLTADPREKTSLVGSEEHQGLRRELRRRLAEWMRDTGDLVVSSLGIRHRERSSRSKADRGLSSPPYHQIWPNCRCLLGGIRLGILELACWTDRRGDRDVELHRSASKAHLQARPGTGEWLRPAIDPARWMLTSARVRTH